MPQTAGIGVVAIRNKADLTEGREACDAFAASPSRGGLPCLTLSAYDADDVLTKLTPLLENKTTILIGQSGMGKSTLINVLALKRRQKPASFPRPWTSENPNHDGYAPIPHAVCRQ